MWLAGLALVALAIARISFPENTVGNPLSILSALIIGFLFSWSVIESKTNIRSVYSAWPHLVVVSSAVAAVLIDSLLRLDLLTLIGLGTSFYVVIVAPLLVFFCFGWWKLLTGSSETIARQDASRDRFLYIGIAIVALVFFVKWIFNP
jgi:hypothetical protein